MAITNQERVGKAMELLRQGLAPYVEREMTSVFGDKARERAVGIIGLDRQLSKKSIAEWDISALLKLIWDSWNEVFGNTLGRSDRSLVQELRDWRNKWAHQETFSSDDTDRALDSINRLLTAVSAPQADEVAKMKMELRRLIFDEQVRGEKRKAGGSLIEASVTGALKPWREVVTPHPDVATGRYQQAEFAADLWQVHLGDGSDEYRNPGEFFKRTYLTESLKRLLVGAVRRLAGSGGDPVVQLQTNFGGGKTHSMLALYHLFAGVKGSELAGVDAVLADAKASSLPKAKRVVLVGNKISPGNPSVKADGTVVRTLWGELAYQLGGKEAYARIAKDDENGTSPGDVLRQLFNDAGPCLILIDEWVAYARQLHDKSDLPAGSFETQFTFAQTLTESAKNAKKCLLVISLPASDTASPHTQPDDVEVGGIRGREALERLRNAVGRVESSWRPASAEEGFEIVRRRLFEPLSGENFKLRDVTARAFADLYRTQSAEFPPECKSSDYEKRLQAAYPIHPEVFDRLYTDWSTLVKFQRTRGVLRLMAAVIHSLWEKGDRNPLILPSTVPIDDSRVLFELTRYLSDNWLPIIEKDVDGPNSLPLKIDNDVSNLGKAHACRRVARTVYLGSAPLAGAAHLGLEDRRVKLGCVMPGESPAIFGDALRRLASVATYLYQDGTRVWYSTQPTVTKLADDRAEQLARNPDKVTEELEKRIRAELRQSGDFKRTHPLPQSGADVPDDFDSRLVVLRPEQSYSREAGSAAEAAAAAILESRGSSPRLYRNTVVFLAADKVRLRDLEDAIRRYLAWDSIIDDSEALNLTPYQKRQAETQRQAATAAVDARLPETYQWAIVPTQSDPKAPIRWEAFKLGSTEPLAVRVSRKLRSEELLLTNLGATILKKHLDGVPLWRGDHVSLRQLVEDFARYVYLPRISSPEVLLESIRGGVSSLTWQSDTFAYADDYDAAAARYQVLTYHRTPQITVDSSGLIVKANVAAAQVEKESLGARTTESSTSGRRDEVQPTQQPFAAPQNGDGGKQSIPQLPRRFFGSVELSPDRVGRDAGRIADEVISHLSGIVGAEVKVTLEIEATIPGGVSEKVVRTVTENGRTLKFKSQGFERE